MMRRSTSVCREEQRRRRDSNPRNTCVFNGFQNRPTLQKTPAIPLILSKPHQ